MMRRIDVPLIMLWLLILGLGTVMVASSAAAIGTGYLARHGVFLTLAGLAFACMLVIPLSWWQRGHRLAWLLAAVLCVVVLIPGIGTEVNGARRWIGLGGFSIQPAEVAKFLLLVYLAGYLARFDKQLPDEPMVLVRPLLMIGVVGGLLLKQPDFGSIVVIGSTAIGLMFIAGARLRHFMLAVILAAGALVLLAYAQPYRLERLITFTDPWSFAYGSGYQLTQALIAFGRGELFGLGLGEGIQKLFYLPEAHNDFIFAVIAEELGLVGALFVVLLFCLLVLRLLRIARRTLQARRSFAGYLIYGVALLLGVQSLINLGVNTGVLPTKGLTLPFVSYGGNSLIVCCAMLGLVCRSELESAHG